MNSDTLEGKADQLIGAAKKKWAKLGNTDFELLAKGQMQEFSGKVQEAYGKSRDEAEKEISEFKKSCGCSSSEAA